MIESEESTDSAQPAADRPSISDQVAVWAFVAVIVAAVPIIFQKARDQWFFLDEWSFLAGRDLDSVDGLLQPHNEHWSTVPIVIYRVIWEFVGLHHYWPYLLVVVVFHLALAVELRLVMRRAGVDAWIATAGASLFALFGGGRENITWAFQMGFTGSVTFGVAAILFADHEPGSARARERDIAAAIAILISLMSSGIGIPLTVALAVSVLLRRGWRSAAVVVMPGGALFLLWYLAYADRSTPLAFNARAVELAVNILRTTAANLGATTRLGYLLVAAAVVGFAIAIIRHGKERWRGEWAPVIALVVGAVAFVSITSVGRALLTVESPSRYRHILLALTLPAIGVGLTALGRLWRPATWIAVALLVAAVPVNVDRLEAQGTDRLTLGTPDVFLATASVEPPAAAPDDLRPFGRIAEDVTLGWLDVATREGKVPDPGPLTDLDRGTAELRVALTTLWSSEGEGCREIGPLQPARLDEGDVLRVSANQVALTEVRDGSPVSGPLNYWAVDNDGVRHDTLVVQVFRPMVLRVQAAGASAPTEVCDRP